MKISLKQLSCRARHLQSLNNLEAFRGDTELLDLGHNYFYNNQSATDLKNNVLRYMPFLRVSGGISATEGIILDSKVEKRFESMYQYPNC